MLQKHPKPVHRRYIKTGAKIFFIVEAVAFAISYGIYYKLNTDRGKSQIFGCICAIITRTYLKVIIKSANISTAKISVVVSITTFGIKKANSNFMGSYIRSVFWLIGTAALGYTLLLVTTPDERIVAEKFPESHNSDALKRKQLIVDRLRQAAESNTPMYRQTKEEIEAELLKKN